jgi:hypothetical protein
MHPFLISLKILENIIPRQTHISQDLVRVQVSVRIIYVQVQVCALF